MFRSYEDDYKTLINEDDFKLYDSQSCNSTVNNNKQSYEYSLEELEMNLSRKTIDASYKNMNSIAESERRVGKWTEQEDEVLRELVLLCGGKNWKSIAENIKGRSPIQCLHRWTKILQPGLVKGPWSLHEDRQLLEWVKREGATKWSHCAEQIKGRNGKQCRERWFNSLNPSVKKGNWTTEEDFNLFFYYKKLGGKWSKIAFYFEGRTENSIKNRFYSTLRRFASERRKDSSKCDFHNDEMTNDYAHREENENDSMSYISGIEDLKKLIPIAEETMTYRLINLHDFKEEDFKKYEVSLMSDTRKVTKQSKSFKIERFGNSDCISDTYSKMQSSMGHADCEKMESTNSDSKPSVRFNMPINIKTCNNNNNNSTPQQIPNTTFNLNLSFNSNIKNSYIHPPNQNYDNNQINHDNQNLSNMYKSMDFFSLEKDIADMCDTNLLFNEYNYNIDNELDVMLEKMFNNNNANLTCDPFEECNFCPVENLNSINYNFPNMSNCISNEVRNETFNQPAAVVIEKEKEKAKEVVKEVVTKKTGSKSDVFQTLLAQLNGLEKLVKNAKKELSKFEKQDSSDDLLEDNLFKN